MQPANIAQMKSLTRYCLCPSATALHTHTPHRRRHSSSKVAYSCLVARSVPYNRTYHTHSIEYSHRGPRGLNFRLFRNQVKFADSARAGSAPTCWASVVHVARRLHMRLVHLRVLFSTAKLSTTRRISATMSHSQGES